MVLIALRRTIVLLLMSVTGFACTKAGMINKERSKGLSDLTMYVLTPAVIISSLQIDYDEARLKGFIVVFVGVLIGYLVNIFVAKLIFRNKDEDARVVFRFASVFPNGAYMGIPMAQGIIGDEGVFYMAAAVAAVNLLVFTVDITYMEKDRSKLNLKSMFLSPTVLSILIGITAFVLRIRLPELIMTPIQMMGSAVTPMAMIVAGYSIANTNFRDMSYMKNIGFSIIWKLFVVPVTFAAAMALIPGFDIPRLAAIICMATPTGAYSVFLAVKYDRNDSIASQMFTYTTILSSLTIPAVMWIISFMGYHL